MTSEFGLRVIDEPRPHPGAWNMAVDEALLISALEQDVATLRVYEWEAATVSLGYFQSGDPEEIPVPLRTLPTVRRLSGGGALLHHHEWTYSLTLPAGHPFAVAPHELYDRVHAATIGALATFGVAASTHADATRHHFGQVGEAGPEPFLCFARRDPRDLVVAGHKVLGSAQRRRRQAVLQHGGLLLKASSYLPELPGLLDVAGRSIHLGELRAEWQRQIVRELGFVARPSGLTGGELELAAELVRSRYQAVNWRTGSGLSGHP